MEDARRDMRRPPNNTRQRAGQAHAAVAASIRSPAEPRGNAAMSAWSNTTLPLFPRIAQWSSRSIELRFSGKNTRNGKAGTAMVGTTTIS